MWFKGVSNNENSNIQNIKEIQKYYLQKLEYYNMLYDCSLVFGSLSKKYSYRIKKYNNNLYMFPELTQAQLKKATKEYIDNLELFVLPISNIQYYCIAGETEKELQISGGQGGGSSLKGAIIGGVIAGSTGAIIGSRKKTEPIISKTITKDNRYIEFCYISEEKKQIILRFNLEYLNVFQYFVPEKYKDKQNIQYIDIPEQIKKLAELKDSGVLTEEEFVSKKQELLARL